MKKLLIALLPITVYAQPTNLQFEGATATQAKISYTAPSSAACTLAVTDLSGWNVVVYDVSHTVFPNSNNDLARASTVTSGRKRIVVLGDRTTATGADGKIYSRALQAYTDHDVTVTCGSAATLRFRTANIAIGNSAPDAPIYNAAGYGGYGHPTFDWTDKTKVYVDPQTGLAHKPGFNWFGRSGKFFTALTFLAAYDPQSSWTNDNEAIGTTSYASISGSQDPLILLPQSAQPVNAGSFGGLETVTDFRLVINGSGDNASADNRTVNVCMISHTNGLCVGNTLTVVLPQTTPSTQNVPSTTWPDTPFGAWGDTMLFLQNELPPFARTGVNVTSGVASHATKFHLTDAFRSDLVAGDQVHITTSDPTCPGNLCTVASVDNPGQITLSETGLNLTNVTVTGAAWGVKIWKTTATGSVSVRATYDVATDMVGRVGFTEGGGSDLCSDVEFTPASIGEPVRMCFFQARSGYSTVHLIITRTGEIRQVGVLQTNGPFTTNPDDFFLGVEFPKNPFINRTDASDPGRAFMTQTVMRGTGSLKQISKATYRGNGDEWIPGYKLWNPVAGFAGMGEGLAGTTCLAGEYKYGNLCWELLTKTAENKSVYQLCSAVDAQFDAELDAGLWNSWEFSALTGDGRYAVVQMMGSGIVQDSIKTICHIDLLAPGGPVATWAMATADPASGGKYGGNHGTGSAVIGTYYSIGVATLGRGNNQGTSGLYGPMESIVTQVWRSTDGVSGTWDNNTALTNTYTYNCPANSWGATGSNCVKVRVESQPCYDNPLVIERTLYPCATDANKSNFRNHQWEPGDYVSENDNTTEVMRILQVTVNAPNDIEIWLHRNAFIDPGPAFFIGSKSATVNGWTLRGRPDYTCGSGDAGLWWIDASGANQQVVFGDCFQGHGDIGSGPYGKASSNAVQAFRVGHGRDDIEDWTSATKQTLGYGKQINVLPVSAEFSWNGLQGGTDFHTELQSYPSLRHPVAPPNDDSFFMDQRAVLAAAGGSPNGTAEIAMTSGVNRTLVLNGGRTNVWKFSRTMFTGTSYIKRNTIDRWMSGHTFRQKSGPNSVLTDADTSTFCQVYVSGECIPIADGLTTQPGEIYFVPPAGMKVYHASDGCYAGSYDTQVPCFVPSNPTATQAIQWDLTIADRHGKNGRRLGNGFTGISRQFIYTNARVTPDAKYGFTRSYWTDGKMDMAWTLRLPPWPGYDSVRRDTYVQTPITLGAGAQYAEIRFGYTEHGTPSQFYCTERQEACSTSSPASLTNPFAYIQTDTRTLTACSSGCTINVPALPGRMLWWQEYRSADGTAWTAVGKPQPTAIR